MLTIRKEQFDALSVHLLQDFEDRMVRYLASTFPEALEQIPEAPAREAHLRQLIRQGSERAQVYGIDTEADVADFITLMTAIHPDFEQMAEMQWARLTLQNREYSGRSKMRLIIHRLPDHFPKGARQAKLVRPENV